jgi:hypothetical protein
VLPFGWLLGCAVRSRSFLAGSALLVSVLLLASTPVPAVAGGGPHKGGPYKVKGLRLVSGLSPFAGGYPGARFDDQASIDAVGPAHAR